MIRSQTGLKKRITVLLLTSSFPSHSQDVHSLFMRDLVHSLSIQNHRIVILCPHQSGLPTHEEQNGYTIIRFPYWFTKSGQHLGGKGGIIASIQNSPISVLQLFPFFICQFLSAYRIIQKEQINLIHSHWIVPQGLTGALLQLLTDIPHITSVHGTDIHLVHSKKWAHPLIRFIDHFSDCITTNSSHTKRILHEILPSSEKTRIIPMGIFPDEFKGVKKLQHKENKKILFVGRLIAWKGVKNLISAMKIVTSRNMDSRLFIIGDGPEREELVQLAEELHITSNIVFFGNVERQILLTLYQNVDVFVLPSITHNNQTEGLGVVLLEAMGSGLPVIGSNTGGIPDIIEDGVNGLLVPPGDPEALADAIVCIFENPVLAERFREAGLKTVRERFSWDSIADQFVEVYTQILKSKSDDLSK